MAAKIKQLPRQVKRVAPSSSKLPVSEQSDSKQLQDAYGLTERHLQDVQELGRQLAPLVPEFVAAFYVWLKTQPDFERFFSDSSVLRRVQDLQRAYWKDFFRAQLDDAYVGRRRRVGEVHALINLPLTAYFTSMNFAQTWFSDRLSTMRRERMAEEIAALTRLMNLDTGIVVATYTRRTNEIIAQQNQSLLELSTPVIRLWDGIVLLPLIGAIDTMRASQMIERLLHAIVETESRVAILDVSGMLTVDTQVAHHILKTISASKMLGAEVIVTGLNPDTAQTLSKLGVDLSTVNSRGSLRAGVAEALARVGKKVEGE